MVCFIEFFALFQLAHAFSCLDEDGQFVDSWAAFKANNGADVYFHDASTGPTFAAGQPMNASTGSIISTISQLYGSLGASYAYALYNDETPSGSVSSARAHSKGVLLFNGQQGFWLVHSFPKWPAAVEDGYSGLPSERYAQSFSCVSFRLDQLERIAAIQLLQWPLVYSSAVSSDLEASLPQFASWIGGNKILGTSLVTSLESHGGHIFTHYAKSRECACALYEDVVAPGVGDGLLVETWQNGALDLKMPSFCPPEYAYPVTNVTRVRMPDGREWKETQDHSKWAISLSKTVACIGDINRQSSQSKRGGGTLCAENADLWKALNSAVLESFRCDSVPAVLV